MITTETKKAIRDLLSRATGKRVEYILALNQQGNLILPGRWTWGGVRTVKLARVTEPNTIGSFHTHSVFF